MIKRMPEERQIQMVVRVVGGGVFCSDVKYRTNQPTNP